MNIDRFALIVFLMLLMWAMSARSRSLFNAISIACTPWLLILIGQEMLAPDFEFNTSAAMMIGLALSSLALGTHIGLRRTEERRGTISIAIRPRRRILWHFVLWLFAGNALMLLLIPAYFIYVLGIGATGNGGVTVYPVHDAIFDSAASWPWRIGTSLTYVGAALCGIEIARTRRPTVAVTAILALVVLQGLITTNRTITFTSLGVASLTWATIAAQAAFRRLTWKHALGGVVAICAIVGIFWAAANRRTGSQEDVLGLRQNTTVSLLGSPSVLAIYLERDDEWQRGTFRGSTILGPLALVGLAERGRWSYETLFTNDTYGFGSNIYTGIGLILEDIGISGMLILMTTLGWACAGLSRVFNRTLALWSAVWLSNLYLFLAWLPIVVQSYYVFWFAQFVVVAPIASFFFVVSREPDRALLPVQSENVDSRLHRPGARSTPVPLRDVRRQTPMA